MILNRASLIGLALVLRLALAGSAHAQEPGPGAKAATEAANGLSILQTAEAKADLNLKPEQLAALSKLREEHSAAASEKMRPPQGLSGEELLVKGEPIWQELAANVNARLAEILDADQLKRHGQIMLQMRGYAAFLDREVQEALEFSDEQKAKISTIRDELVKEARETLASAKDDRRAANKKLIESIERANSEALSLLTEAQKQLWSERIGKEFKRPALGAIPPQPAPR
jgi:hypothetical protein